MFEKFFHTNQILIAFMAGVGTQSGLTVIMNAPNNDLRLVGLFTVLACLCALYKVSTINRGLRACIEAVVNTIPKEKFDKMMTDYYTQPKKGD